MSFAAASSIPRQRIEPPIPRKADGATRRPHVLNVNLKRAP
jgi:hypothetical protein